MYRPFADLASLKEAVLSLEAAHVDPASLQLEFPATQDDAVLLPLVVPPPRRPEIVGVG